MPWVVFHEDSDAGAGFGNTGAATWFQAGVGVGQHEIPQVSELTILKNGGVGCSYNGRLYVCNQYTDNILVDEHLRMHRLGIVAPDIVPTIASGGGGVISGMSGVMIGYVSYYDILTNERSSLSAASASFDNVAGANAIAWSNLPTTSPNPRVTHIELWRSVDGGSIRFVGRRTLGTATATEQVPTLSLGEVAPDFFERFPPCKMNAMYHDRMYLAGDREHPDTLYGSAMFFPERWEGLSFRTRNGEPITAIVNVRDMLLVCCPNSSYVLQGYSEDDAVFSMSEPELGALNMRGVKLAHGNAIIPNSKSIYLFNGAWHNIMPDGMDEWRRAYDLFPEEMEAGFGVFTPAEDVYKFGAAGLLAITTSGVPPIFPDFYTTSGSTEGTLYWVGDMRPCVPQLEGSFGQPNWSFDFRDRVDLCAGVLAVPGWTRPQLATGSFNTGYIRLENSTDNFDDDSDTFFNRFVVQTGGYLMGQPGGGPEDGKTLRRFWTYVRSEYVAWEMRVMGGDDEANLGLSAIKAVFNNQIQYMTTVDPSEDSIILDLNPPTYEFRAGFKGVHHHVPEKVSGRAFFVMVTAASPEQVVFRGFGGTWVPGPATRGIASVDLLE